MSIWYYVLIVIGGLVGGFVIAFMFFFMITYISDWFLKRKMKKQTPTQMLKPLEPPISEKGVFEDERTIRRNDNEFREYEKLRTITKGERGVKPRSNEPTNNRGNEERSEIPSKLNIGNKPTKPNNGKGYEGIRFY